MDSERTRLWPPAPGPILPHIAGLGKPQPSKVSIFSTVKGANGVDFASAASFCHETVIRSPMVNPMGIVRI
jgi:hypothetical protein